MVLIFCNLTGEDDLVFVSRIWSPDLHCSFFVLLVWALSGFLRQLVFGFEEIGGLISVLECLLDLMVVMAFCLSGNRWPLRSNLYGRDLLVLSGWQLLYWRYSVAVGKLYKEGKQTAELNGDREAAEDGASATCLA